MNLIDISVRAVVWLHQAMEALDAMNGPGMTNTDVVLALGFTILWTEAFGVAWGAAALVAYVVYVRLREGSRDPMAMANSANPKT